MIRTGKLKEDMDKKEMARMLREKGWEADEARSVGSNRCQWQHADR